MALQRTVDKWRMKHWFTVHAPKLFNEERICEMPADDEKKISGRKLKVSLEQLTHNPQNAFSNAVVRVTDVNGDVAHTQLISIDQPNSYIRSLIRRYRSVVSIVAPVTAKDNARMVLKIVAITRSRVAHTKLRGIRKEITDFVYAYSKENAAEAIAASVIEGKLQAEMAGKVSHITPMHKVEVRRLELH